MLDSTQLREQGNEEFKKQNFQAAIERYTEAITALTENPSTDTIKTELTKCFSNRCQCHLHLEQYEEAIADATRGTYLMMIDVQHFGTHRSSTRKFSDR